MSLAASWPRHSIQMAVKATRVGAGLLARQLTFPQKLSALLDAEVRPYFSETVHGPVSVRPEDVPLYAMARFVGSTANGKHGAAGVRCVETGVLRGRTSEAILLGLMSQGAINGRLYSVDLPAPSGGRHNADGRYDDAALLPWERPGCDISLQLRPYWELTEGDSTKVLAPLLDRIGDIDLFFHDSDHSYRVQSFEYEQAWKHLRTGGLLISDDIDWNPAFSDFAKAHHRVPVRWYLDRRGVIRK